MKSLSYFNRIDGPLALLSDNLGRMHSDSIVSVALEIADYLRTRIICRHPESRSVIDRYYDKGIRVNHCQSSRRRIDYSLLLEYASCLEDPVSFRYSLALAMFLSTYQDERYFIDALLIYFSAVLEAGDMISPSGAVEKGAKERMEVYVRGTIEKLKELDSNGGDSKKSGLPGYLRTRSPNGEAIYSESLKNRMEADLVSYTREYRSRIYDTWYEKYAPGLKWEEITNYTNLTKMHPCYSRRNRYTTFFAAEYEKHSTEARLCYALIVAEAIFDKHSDDERLVQAMRQILEKMKEHRKGRCSRSEVIKCLRKLELTGLRCRMFDSLRYELASFTSAFYYYFKITDKADMLRYDLTSSLVSNYLLESPRIGTELVNYHVELLRKVSWQVESGLLDAEQVIEGLGKDRNFLRDQGYPKRPDPLEIDIELLKSGIRDMKTHYAEVSRYMKTPYPLLEVLKVDPLNEKLIKDRRLINSIYKVTPPGELMELVRSKGYYF